MRLWGRLRSRFSNACKFEVLRNKIVQDFDFNVRHQLDEHLVGLGLVFDERILLREGSKIDALAQAVHRIQMLLPKAIDRVENDVSLEAAQGFFVLMDFLL